MTPNPSSSSHEGQIPDAHSQGIRSIGGRRHRSGRLLGFGVFDHADFRGRAVREPDDGDTSRGGGSQSRADCRADPDGNPAARADSRANRDPNSCPDSSANAPSDSNATSHVDAFAGFQPGNFHSASEDRGVRSRHRRRSVGGEFECGGAGARLVPGGPAAAI
ncbi:MAG: hypothetical protein O2921_01625 [Chloroflexi bacterium]|nr:hypothetical protein [Chloroflexota bacterium]